DLLKLLLPLTYGLLLEAGEDFIEIIFANDVIRPLSRPPDRLTFIEIGLPRACHISGDIAWLEYFVINSERLAIECWVARYRCDFNTWIKGTPDAGLQCR